MPTSSSARRVLLVDDHELVRTGIAELIASESDLTVCGEAADAPTALRLLGEARPHVAVIDLTLQEGSGLELIKQVRALNPDVKMVVCSMHDGNIYAERALQAGAMAYVNKQEPAETIVTAIRRVLQDRIFVSEEIEDRILRRKVLGRERDGSATANVSPVESLSDRELEVLELLGNGLTTREIAARLNLSAKTIDTYREHLKAKLDLSSATELLRYAVTWNLDPDRVRRKAGEGT